MRVVDRPVPTVGGHRPDVEPFPAVLYVGIEKQPVASYVYDDFTAFYDSPITPPPYVYDDLQDWPYERMDLWCQLHGLTITVGATDPDIGPDAGTVTMTLDNRDGQLSQYDAQGRLVDYFPGRALDIWAVHAGEAFWLWSGTITAWRERPDETVEAEAFDVFSELNRDVAEWDPGLYGNTVVQRLDAICDEWNYTGRRRFTAGDVTLHSYFTQATPLEELRSVARSDGGMILTDADGTLVYFNRFWALGRDDQPAVPVMSDNICTTPIIVWDAELSTDDDVIANIATLTNVAGETVTATNQASVDRYGPQTIPGRNDDQWIGTAAGTALAEHLVIRRGDGYLRLTGFALYLHDRRHDYWRTAIDLRIGDVITFLHEQPSTTGPNLIALQLIVAHIVHDITPETWVTTVATSRAVGAVTVLRYDRTSYRYDQAGAIYAL